MHYAMFHAAKALLTVSPGKNLRKHTAVIAAFGEYWSKTGRIEPEYHRYLLQAFNARNKADYVLGQTHSAEDAQRFYLYAEAMIRRVRQLLES